MTITEISIFFPLAQGASGGGGFGQFLPIILLFVGMWFLIIAPQRKRQKAHDKMLSELRTLSCELFSTPVVEGTGFSIDSALVRALKTTVNKRHAGAAEV